MVRGLSLTKKAILLAAYLLSGVVMCMGQNTPTSTTKGNDFWVMFPYNHNYNSGSHPEHQKVYVMGDQQTNVTVTGSSGSSSPTLTSPSYSVMVLCGNTTMQVATVWDGGYHITTSQDVWVYADDYIDHNQDAALVLPTEALDTFYIVQDYPSTNDRGAEVAILATQDNTVVTMTVPCNVLNTSITAGTTLTVTLNSGQTYMLLAAAGGSFSGMEVTSNGKPFALFVAGQNTAVPTNGNGRDFTFEQALPVSQWGTEFIVSGTPPQTVNRVRITASADSCMITRNGSLLAGPLLRGETYEADLPPSNQWHITSSSPVQVVLYLGSYNSSGSVGDPASITIPPLNRGLDDYYFPIINTPAIPATSHYLTIICNQNYDAGFTLDNNPLPSSGVATIGSYTCHRLSIPSATAGDGLHKLHNSLGPFVAYVYGLGNDWESYGFPLGMTLQDPTGEGETQYDTVEYYDTTCIGIDYTGYGFGLTAANNVNAGNITMVRDETNGNIHTHFILHLTVLSNAQSDLYDTIVYGDTLWWNSLPITSDGTFSDTLTAANGCDSIVTLHVSFTGFDTVFLFDTVCVGSPYNGNGFAIGSTATAGDTILTRHSIEAGIPTLFLLRLTLLPTFATDTSVEIINGDTLFFADTLITLADDYTFVYTAANGCDSIVTLHIAYAEVGLTASANGICPGDEVLLTATGTHTFLWGSSPYDPELDSQQGENPATVHPNTTTVYHLLDGAGNIVSSITIGTEPPPTPCVETNRPFVDFDYPKVTFTDCSEGHTRSSWVFSDGIAMNGEHVLRKFNYPLPDSITVTLTSCNRYNCCADTTFSLPCRIRSLWFPNIFTPDEDENNLFRCFTSREIVEFEIDIFNRWGLHIWNTTDPNEGWDGRRTDGTPCTQDAYVYKYYWRDADGDAKSGIGTVTLIR